MLRIEPPLSATSKRMGSHPTNPFAANTRNSDVWLKSRFIGQGSPFGTYVRIIVGLHCQFAHKARGLVCFHLFLTECVVGDPSSLKNPIRGANSVIRREDQRNFSPLRVVENMQLHVKENGEMSMSSSNGGSEVREAPSSRSSSLLEVATPALELKTNVRMQLYTYGTSLVTNDNDLTGDGDQSPVEDAVAQQMYQDLFRTGQ